MNPGVIVAIVFGILIAAFLIWAKYEAKKITKTKKDLRNERRLKKYGV